MGTTGTCESCGVDDEFLTPVRRIYPADAHGNTSRRVVDEVERWCVPCLTSYPHEPAD